MTDLQGITATGGRLNLHKSLITLLDSCSTFSNGCLPPYNLTVSNSTDSSVQLNWTVADTSAELFRIQYKKPSDPTWQAIIVPADTFYTLYGLEECTSYEFQVESICDSIFGTASGFFATMPFQTEGCCNPPETLFASDINNNQFTANWNPIFGAQSYNLSYQELGNTSWTDTTIIDTFFQINSLLPCTDYYFRVKAICNNLDNGYSDTILVRTTGCGACLDLTYCESAGQDVNFEWIDQVSIGSVFNQSGKNGGYGNFTGNSFQLVIDSIYQINLTPGFSGFAFSESWRIWIDLNQDGFFNDSTEQVFGTNTAQNGIVSGQFSIPAGTMTGGTRMRVSMRFGGFSGNTVPSPCETFSEGEVEDYCVEITSETSPICPAPSNLNFVFTAQTDSVIVTWDTVGESNNNYEIRIKNLVNGAINQFPILGDSTSITGLSSCTKYEVSVRSICDNFFSSFSSPKLLLTKGCGPCLDEDYCIPLETSTINGWLREVEIGKISHISGDDQGYAIFDNIPFSFNRGNVYSFTLTSSTNQSNFFYAIYADWNQDGVFELSSEEAYNSQIAFNDSVSNSFTVPGTTPLGNTRLRIIMSSDSIKDACGNISNGEIQDYCLEIIAGDANETLLSNPKINIYPNPASSEFTIESEKMMTSIRLLSIHGQVVYSQSLTSATNITIPISQLSSGVYFVEINLGKRKVLRKILVENN